jgi:hypothetical protein
MKPLIIFGAGNYGGEAFSYYKSIYNAEILYFVDNDRNKKEFLGVQVISVEQLKRLPVQYKLVVASEFYHDEISAQLVENGFSDFCVFSENDFSYPTVQVNGKWKVYGFDFLLSNYKIEKFNKIAIYGINSETPLLLELLRKKGLDNSITGLICKNEGNLNVKFEYPIVALEDIWDKIDCLIIATPLSK